MYRGLTTSPGTRRRRRAARRVWAALGVVLVASVLTGCRPNPVLKPVTPPGGDWTALVSMNASGVAVGVTSRADGAHAIAYDTHRGSFVELPDPGPSAELPSGGTFIRANDIDDNGVVLGSVAPRPDGHDTALFDTVAGTWQFFDCSSFFVLGRGSLSNSGLVACGDHVYDSNTKTAIAVPMPPDCDGQVFKVNASSIAVGSCHGGPEPLFATDLTTGTTVGFGTAAGIVTDADDLALTPTFTDSGWLVAGQTVNGIGRTFVFRVPSHLGSTVPSLVDLGPFSDGPTRAPAIDDHGLLAGNFRIGGTWMFGTYDVVTGEIERLDDRALPEAVDPGDTLITGIDDTGAVVGIQMNIPGGPIYQSFATAPD